MAVSVRLQLVGLGDSELSRHCEFEQLHRLLLLVNEYEVGLLESRTQVGADRAAAGSGVARDVTEDGESLGVDHLRDVASTYNDRFPNTLCNRRRYDFQFVYCRTQAWGNDWWDSCPIAGGWPE